MAISTILSSGGHQNHDDKIKGYQHYKITSYVVLTCMIAASGGLIYGYDIGISGGVTSMESFLKFFFPKVYEKMINDPNVSNYCKFDSQLLTTFTSSLYISGFFSTFIASFITKNYGRKSSISVGGTAFLIGSAIGGAAKNIYMLIIGRVLLGFGLGFTNQSVPIYLSETAPPHLRGAFVSGFQVLLGIGNISANLVNFGTEKIKGGWGWRISLAMAAVPALILMIGSFFLHETPISIIENADDDHADVALAKAKRLLYKIRGTHDIDQELNDLLRVSEISKSVNNPFKNLLKRKYRPQFLMSLALPFFNQISGINVIAFFAPIIFRTLGMGESESLLLSLVVTGVIGACSMFLSLLIIDRLGRRVLLCFGGILMFLSLVMVGGVMIAKLGDHGQMSKSYNYIVLLFISIYVASFGVSWGPANCIITSEIFPLDIRPAAQAINIAIQFFFTVVVAHIFLPMLCLFKGWSFFFFAGWVLFMTLFVYFLMPETKNVPIERMDQIWGEHWFWKRFVEDEDEDGGALP